MIRQAISCDICGAEKKQTNHWFVAWEQAGELRVSGWNSRNRLRAGSKHLCGQVCMHKLADDFMARVIAQKVAGKLAAEEGVDVEESAGEMPAVSASGTAARGPDRPAGIRMSPAPGLSGASRASVDTSLTAPAAYAEFESSARLLPSEPVAAAQTARPAASASLVTMRERQHPGDLSAAPDEPPRFASRNWRAEAWQRERERTRRAAERRPKNEARRMGAGD